MNRTYTCDYAVTDPQTLARLVEYTFAGAMVSWRDIDEESFEIVVVSNAPIEDLDNFMELYLCTYPSDWDDCDCDCGFDPYMGCYTDDC